MDPFYDPLNIKKLKATVITDIWPELLFFSAVATMVTLVSAKTSHSLAISSQMLTVLGTVLGLVISFRTSSAYDRFWEGRKLWTSINLSSRNLGQLIWLHVPNERTKPKSDNDTSSEKKKDTEEDDSPELLYLKALIEKKTMINLIQAFSVAVKHMLRGEPGIYYQDLYPLISFLPRYAAHPTDATTQDDLLPLWEERLNAVVEDQGQPETRPSDAGSASVLKAPYNEKELTEMALEEQRARRNTNPHKRVNTFDPEQVLPHISPQDRHLAPARNPPRTSLYEYFPPLLIFRPFISVIRLLFRVLFGLKGPEHLPNGGKSARNWFGKKRKRPVVQSNIPLEITLFLSSYVAWLLKEGLIQPSVASAFVTNVSTLQDTMANLDRIRLTPIPFAYQAHLRMSIWLYIFFLPFQMYSFFGYLTIPATTFAAFLLLGFLEIGQEIENPFNYDLNDLDLDRFCLVIERELHEITAHPSPDPSTYLFTPWNQPFAPADRRTAQQMIYDLSRSSSSDSNNMSEAEAKRRLQRTQSTYRRTLLRGWREVSEATIDWRKE